MPADTEDTGFLSRWSRRKALVRQGVNPAESDTGPSSDAVVESRPRAPAATAEVLTSEPAAPIAAQAPSVVSEVPAAEAPPPPNLADVAELTRDSDYSRFVARSVQPEVRNAALGKLFSDPHFNVMDGLDTYIDDYGKPDPLPESMLRKMLQAQAMGLFDDENKDPPAAHPAQPPAAVPPPPEPVADENTDLQLQPDDDAGCAGAEPCAGEDAGRAH